MCVQSNFLYRNHQAHRDFLITLYNVRMKHKRERRYKKNKKV
jgi:hypothetical protein